MFLPSTYSIYAAWPVDIFGAQCIFAIRNLVSANSPFLALKLLRCPFLPFVEETEKLVVAMRAKMEDEGANEHDTSDSVLRRLVTAKDEDGEPLGIETVRVRSVRQRVSVTAVCWA